LSAYKVVDFFFFITGVNDVTSAQQPPSVISVPSSIVPTTLGDNTMQIVQPAKFITAQREVKNHDMTIILGYAAVALVFDF
jgi:hypothetical protein